MSILKTFKYKTVWAIDIYTDYRMTYLHVCTFRPIVPIISIIVSAAIVIHNKLN